MRAKDAVGHYGEQVAADYLQSAGMVILDRNWRCREGEIDIVVRDGDAIVFCEVKSRSGTGFGHPAEAVTARKARRIRVLACRWLTERRPPHSDVRFDVVSVQTGPGPTAVQHLRGAF